MKHCPLCGQENQAGSIFCPYCGQKIVRDAIGITHPVSLWPTAADGIDAALAQRVEAMSLWVRSTNGLQSVTLPEMARFVLGRSAGDQQAPPDVDLSAFNAHNLGVSRLHAAIDDRPYARTVTDLDSRNGTDLNGLRLQPNQAYFLRDKDVLCLGKLVLYVHV